MQSRSEVAKAPANRPVLHSPEQERAATTLDHATAYLVDRQIYGVRKPATAYQEAMAILSQARKSLPSLDFLPQADGRPRSPIFRDGSESGLIRAVRSARR